jgi:DDE family transposase
MPRSRSCSRSKEAIEEGATRSARRFGQELEHTSAWWAARSDGAWNQQQARCPEGKTSISWTPSVDHHKNEVVKIKFSSTDCRLCPQRTQCVRSKKRYPRRMLTIRRERQDQALQAARQREGTKAFQKEYDRRAGIEGTISRGVRTARLRRTPYIGQDRTHLGHVLTAVGLNWLRLGEWLMDMPRAKTRRSPFTRLMAGTGAT